MTGWGVTAAMDATLAGLLGQVCDIYRPTKTIDGFGDKVDAWPDVPTSTQPCRFQLTGGSEDTDAKDVAVGQGKLFLPPEADVSTYDRVLVDGRWWHEVVTVYPVYAIGVLHHYELATTTANGVVPGAQ